MRGRKPTPTVIKMVKGNPGRRPLPEFEPQFESNIPKCPFKLDKIGQETWDRKAEMLYGAGVLTDADWETLAIYCRVWSQIVLLSAEIQTSEDYLTYEIKIDKKTGEEFKSNAKTNPLCLRLESLYSEYRSYSALFGLDPANRGKIKTGKRNEKAKDKIFSG